jgi:hypothetical protein
MLAQPGLLRCQILALRLFEGLHVFLRVGSKLEVKFLRDMHEKLHLERRMDSMAIVFEQE